jgi:hypothetical protein
MVKQAAKNETLVIALSQTLDNGEAEAIALETAPRFDGEPALVLRELIQSAVITSGLLHARFPPLLGGDLNPLSGFYFPLFSMVFPWEISIRVATCGR